MSQEALKGVFAISTTIMSQEALKEFFAISNNHKYVSAGSKRCLCNFKQPQLSQQDPDIQHTSSHPFRYPQEFTRG